VNTSKIFQDSWSMMLRYRALWIFGVMLALTTISFGSALWMRNNQEEQNRTLVNWEISAKDQAWIRENFGLDLPLTYQLTADDLRLNLDKTSLTEQQKLDLVLKILIGALLTFTVLLVITLTLRYTAETALIRMVNDHQDHHVTYSARQGWKLGFSMAALKLFLIDLLVYPLLFLFSALIFLPAMLPLLIAISGTPAGITIGILLMFSLTLVSAAALIVMWVASLVTVKLAYRACCLEGLDIFAAIWRGFHLLRSQLGAVGLTAFVVAGLDLAYPLLVIPVGLLLAAGGVLGGGTLALALGALLALVLARATAWIIALIAGITLLVLMVFLPLAWMGGLREVFKSSAWTLTFKEAASLKSPAPAPEPAPASSGPTQATA
jgi:hypothetical protein